MEGGRRKEEGGGGEEGRGGGGNKNLPNNRKENSTICLLHSVIDFKMETIKMRNENSFIGVTTHLCNRPCPLIGLSIHRSVHHARYK